jgi:hypothetical protein
MPVIVIVYEPVGVVAEVCTVIAVLPEPPITVWGVKVTVTPEGGFDADIETLPVKAP